MLHPIKSREYKVILNIENFEDRQAGIDKFLDFVKEKVAEQKLDIDLAIDEKRERWTSYLDTANFDLRKHDFVLRRRTSHKPGKPPKNKITLKYRSADRYIAAAMMADENHEDMKFEEDIIKPNDFVSKFSHSKSITFEGDFTPFETVASVIKHFPTLSKVGIPPGHTLETVNGKVVQEIVVEIGKIKFAKGYKAEAEFSFWYHNDELLVAEFSFTYRNDTEIYPATVAQKAKTFFESLNDQKWYNPKAKTKTAYIYGTKSYRFKGETRLENVVDMYSSVSPDREVVTNVFDNLILDLGGSKQGQVSTQVISLVTPVESDIDLTVRLRLDGYVSMDAGVRATLVVHHAGQTTLVDLSEGPCSEEDIDQSFSSPLPAGVDYRVTLFLLIERDTDDRDVGGLLTINTLEAVLEKPGLGKNQKQQIERRLHKRILQVIDSEVNEAQLGSDFTDKSQREAIDALRMLGAFISIDESGYATSLNWGQHSAITDAGLEHIAKLDTLITLTLTQITNDRLAYLKQLTNLKHLIFDPIPSGGSHITDDGLIYLKGLLNLEILHLGFAQVTDIGLVHLKGLTNLKSLELPFSSAGITLVGLKTLQVLTTLLYVGVPEEISLEYVEFFPSLETVYHFGTIDSDLRHLRRLNNIKDLGIESSKITDAGLQHLVGLESLEILSLFETQISDEGFRKLQKALPNCEIMT